MPDKALQDTASAVVNYNDSGMSLLEMSHRSQPIVGLMEETTGLVRHLLERSEEHTSELQSQ